MASLVSRSPAASAPTTIRRLAAGGPFRVATTAGTLLMVFASPWHDTFSGMPPFTAPLGFGVSALAAAAILIDGRRWRLSEAQLLAVAFCGFAVLSLVWTIDTSETLHYAFGAVQVAALFLLIWEFCPGKDGARAVARAWVLGCAIVTVEAIVSSLRGAKLVDHRLALGAANPNDLSFLLCLTIPLAWYLSYYAKERWARVLYRLFVPAAMYAIVLLASRSGLVVGLLGALIVPWTLVAGNARRSAALLVGLALSLPFVATMLPSEQATRLEATTSEIDGGTLNGRTVLWSAAWATFADHPFVGVGAGASRDAIAERTGYQLRSHNTPLSVASELGIVGISLFGLLSLTLGWAIRAQRGLDKKVAVILGLVLLVGLQVRHWEYEQGTWTAFAILATLCITPRPVGASTEPVSV